MKSWQDIQRTASFFFCRHSLGDKGKGREGERGKVLYWVASRLSLTWIQPRYLGIQDSECHMILKTSYKNKLHNQIQGLSTWCPKFTEASATICLKWWNNTFFFSRWMIENTLINVKGWFNCCQPLFYHLCMRFNDRCFTTDADWNNFVALSPTIWFMHVKASNLIRKWVRTSFSGMNYNFSTKWFGPVLFLN